MSSYFHAGFWLAVAVAALLGFLPRAMAQARYQARYIEPQLFTFHLSEISAGVYAIGTFNESRYERSDISVSHENFFIGPSLTLAGNGSIYHPNFLRYQLLMDGAFGYQRDSVKSVGTTVREDFEYLGQFSTSLDILPDKPLHGSAFFDYNHSYRDSDFFTRVEVESWRAGGRANWQVGTVTMSADYSHREENSASPYPVTQVTPVVTMVGGTPVTTFTTNQVSVDQNTLIREDIADFNARQERDHGGSSLNYTFNQYTRAVGSVLGEGTDHILGAGDSERFGAEDQHRFNANLGYSRRDALDLKSDDITGNASLALEHRKNLNSYYDFNYERYDMSGFTSDTYLGSATLSHQLYESLASSVTARASDTETSADGSEGYVRRFGGGFTEAYTKRLGSEAKLRVSNSLFIDHTDQQFVGFVQNERHTLGESGAPGPDDFYLSGTRIIESSIVITDGRNVQVFIAGFDYQIFQEGSRTRIQWLIVPGQTRPSSVLASYRMEPTPGGGYESLSEVFNVRLELWKNLWGIYGRVNLSQNNAAEEMHVRDFTSYIAGTDLNWRWLRLGAEYEIYHSTDSDYTATRLYQSLVFQPDSASTWSVNFNETWVNYLNYNVPDHVQEDYKLITRYHRALTHRLGVDLEGGVAYRRGLGVDEVLATCRPSLRYVIGRTSIDAGYEYEYSLFLDRQEQTRHRFSIRLRRVF